MSPEKRNHLRHKASIRNFKSKRGEKWRRMNSSYDKQEKRRLRLVELEQEPELSLPFPYVTLPTAAKAKQLGFTGQTRQYWLTFDELPGLEKNDLLCNWNAVPGEDGSDITSAPTQDELQTWVREKLGVHVKLDVDERGRWYAILVDVRCGNLLSTWSDPAVSYELALEDGLYLTLLSHVD